MVLQLITPEKEIFDLKVSLPKNYLGKEVHCLFYIEDEAQNSTNISLIKTKKPSDFFGSLDKESGDKLIKHVSNSRQEWERGI